VIARHVFAQRVGVQRADGGDVVQDPDAAAVRCDHEIV